MEMIKQGHLEQPFSHLQDQLYFIGNTAVKWRSRIEGKGGSAIVYTLAVSDGSWVRAAWE
jgi:hypothetical protein